MSEVRRVTTVSGLIINVDISVEACRRYGFQSGDRIIAISTGREGLVVGIASIPKYRSTVFVPSDETVLWVQMDDKRGRVCFV